MHRFRYCHRYIWKVSGYSLIHNAVNGAKPDAAETLQVWQVWLGDGDPYLSSPRENFC